MRSAAGQCKHPVDGQWKHVVCWNAGGNGYCLLRAVPEKNPQGVDGNGFLSAGWGVLELSVSGGWRRK